MINIKSKLTLSLILGAMFVTLLGIASVAYANPSIFPTLSCALRTSCRSATASTTVSYISAGRSTTTSAVLDAHAQPSGFALNKATLFVQVAATNTASTLHINIEHSQDGIDWYEEGGTNVSGYATTSNPFYLTPVKNFVLNFASSSPGLGAQATNGTTTRAIKVETLSRYTRAIFSVPPGANGVAIWSEWVPIRESSE